HHNHRIDQVKRYFNQIDKQGIEFCGYFLEGKSKDNTRKELEREVKERKNLFIIDDPTKEDFPINYTNKDRISHLAKLGNILLDKLKTECEYIIYFESDLIIPNNLFKSLLNSIQTNKSGITAPLILCD